MKFQTIKYKYYDGFQFGAVKMVKLLLKFEHGRFVAYQENVHVQR